MRSYSASLLLCVALSVLAVPHASAQTRAEVEQELADAQAHKARLVEEKEAADSCKLSSLAEAAQALIDWGGYEQLLGEAQTQQSLADEDFGISQAAYNQADSALQTANADVSIFEGQLASVQNQIDSLQAQASDLNQQADDIEQQAYNLLEEAYMEFMENPCMCWNVIADAEAGASEMFSEADSLRSEADNLGNEANCLDGDSCGIQSELNQAESEAASAQTTFQAAASDLADATTVRDQAHSLVTDLQADCARKDQEKNNAMADATYYFNLSNQLSGAISEVDNEIAGYNDWLENNP